MKVARKLAGPISCAVAALATMACGGSEEGMPVTSSVVRIALTVTSSDESRIAVRSESAALRVEEVGLAIASIGIEPCESDSAAVALDDYPVDLAVEPPAQALFESGVSAYCGVVLEVEPSSASDPAVLEGLGVYVRGTRSDDLPFEILSELTLSTNLSSSHGEAFGTNHLALGFDLATWFEGADVEGAIVTDGVALIDATSNTDVLEAFEENAEAALALFEDADRDGVLDEDELTAIATP